MAVRIQLRRDTEANWTSSNPVLELGEPGFATDTRKLKIGDGVTAWSSLEYTIIQDFDELTNIPTTLAGYGITDAATSAQGALADSASQPGDGLSTFTNDLDYGLLVGTAIQNNGLPVLPTQTLDISGSVFGDDSTLIVDGVNNIVTADVVGNLTGSLTGNVTGQVSDISNHDTDDLTEGTNKYFSTTLVDNHLSGGTGVDYTTGTISIGQAVATTDNVEFANIKATGYLEGPAVFVIDPAAVGDNTGEVRIAGDLRVDGTTTTINSTTVEVGDKNIVLGADATADTDNTSAGITVSQPESTDATLLWNTTDTEWNISNGLNVAGTITSSGIFTSDTGDASFRRAGSTTARVRIESGTTFSDQNFTVNATQATVDASDPILLLSADAGQNSHLYFGDPDADNIGRLTYSHSSDALQVWVNGANAIEIDSNQDITTTGKLHLADGDAGTITAAASADNLVVEGAGATGMSLLHGTTSATNYSNIYMGNETDGNSDFRMTYFGSDYLLASDRQNFVLRTAGTEALRIDASQDTELAGALSLNGATQTTVLNVYSGADDNVARFESGDANVDIQFKDNTTTDNPRISVTGNDISIGHASAGNAFTVNDSGDATLTGNHTAGDYILDAIAADIADTAVDVFVYDTSKDSDGGAWRKRTQHTSWYNETLNTATRGSRREFPAVAVIVVEADTVTIYDGDDPSLPMWMVFNSGSYYFIGPSNRTKTSAVMVNGILCVGKTGTASWMSYISFIDDTARQYSSVASEKRNYLVPISNRNDSTNSSAVQNSVNEYTLVNDQINDVAMTVLPNAPIDSVTGLPVPTIAVATDGGVSVIKDDGAVVDITQSTVYNQIREIDFSYNNKIIYTMDNAAARSVRVDSIPSLDFVVTSDQLAKGSGEEFYTGNDFGYAAGDLNINLPTGASITKVSGTKLNAREIATTVGLTRFALENQTDPSSGLANFITSDYNTGWMHGDIKLATLSDTDDTDLSISDSIVNGTFDSDVVGWTAITSTIAYSSGTMQITRSGGGGYTAYQAISTQIGATYILTATINSSGSTGSVYINNAVSSDPVDSVAGTNGQTVDVSLQFVAESTTSYVQFAVDNDATSIFVDNVSVRLAELDRSVNNNGLAIVGNITKDPVATGADLVGYTGWGTSNYLQQPYNSDLDFGTGDFCVMGWVRVTTDTAHQGIMHRNDSTGTNGGFLIEYRWDADAMLFQTQASTSVVSNSFTPNDSIELNQWYHFAAACTASGTTHRVYLNGSLSYQNTGHTARDTTNTSAITRIGQEIVNDRPFSGDLALWRISGTAPTAEQIKKIYEDEKFLFQDNAQATLYGTSDLVTALAYDDTTELLHAGTSNGRSVFQGMRRVDNTTDAVGAAISASNGLVAED